MSALETLSPSARCAAQRFVANRADAALHTRNSAIIASGKSILIDALGAVLGDPFKRAMAAQILGQAYVSAHNLVLHNKDAVEKIADERKDELKVVKLNIDEEQEISQRYGIVSIPTIVLFKNGEPAATAIGAQPKSMLEKSLGLVEA